MSFGSMPYDWIKSQQLKDFPARPGVTGRSISALKCYLAIAAYRDWDLGSSTLSIYDLTRICGSTKPTVLEGLTMLGAMGLMAVEVRAAGNVNRYILSEFDDFNFRKVPQDKVVDCLSNIGNRGVRHLGALKLYLVMLYLRDSMTSTAIATHETLIEYSGARPEDVAASNGVLAAAGFVHIRKSSEWSRTGRPTNEYALLGDFAGKTRKRRRPIELRSMSKPA